MATKSAGERGDTLFPQGYDEVLASDDFQADLDSLNTALAAALARFKAPDYLNGNLFYAHLQSGFQSAPLLSTANAKRRRFFEIARHGTTLAEIGVNGGHSLLLAKSANPKLKCIGIDICRQIDPSWARVDVYVPVAMQWLRNRFPGDFQFLIGDSRLEAPRLAVEQPDIRLDILHVDGAKDTYLRDVVNLLPLMHRETLIVMDDSNLKPVQRAIKQLVATKLVEMHPDFPPETDEKYQHAIMRPR